MFSLPPNIDLIKSLILRLKYVIFDGKLKQLLPVKIYRNVIMEVDKSSKISIDEGGLDIGKSWTRKSAFKSIFKLGVNARVSVKGYFSIYEGSSVYINESAELVLGSGYANNKFNLSCFQKISIGKQVVISEGVTIRDSDNHSIKSSGFVKTKPIYIGDHVWIGINSTILKGVTIGKGSIIAAGSVVTRDVPENCLAAGVPAKVIKTNVIWE